MRKLVFLILVLITLAAVFYFGTHFSFREIEILSDSGSSIDLDSSTNKESPVYLAFFEGLKEQFISQKTSFLEVNLWEMKIRAYEEGILKKEVSILKKGDPQEWGGTAAGLYEAKAKYLNAFSVVAEVYMPWTIHFYGKYYVHGEPYYPGGRPLISSVSGGCVQTADKDAKAIYELVEIGMPILVLDKTKDDYEYPKIETTEPKEISSQSYLVADLDSGFVFTQKDAQEELPIASLTKLMAAVVVTENVDLRKWVLVTEKMLEAYGSTKDLEQGKKFRVVELLYPLLIESSNDAAEALTGFMGREKTIKLMNEKTKSILMENTKFVDPSGYDPENVSTAKDLFYLARYIFNNRPLILDITKGKKVSSYGPIDFDIESLWNKNVFIDDQSFLGGKTGFIKTSKYTGLFIFRLKNQECAERNIAIILLGSENEELDTQKIYLWLQENYF